MSSAIIIPGRLNSSRLPGKVLLDLGGKPVIQHVYEKALAADIGPVYIATDSRKVQTVCAAFADVILTQEHHSGTDRVIEAAQRLSQENIINIQGDEPFIDPVLIQKLNTALEQGEYWISAAHEIHKPEDINNPNIVKVVVDVNQHALYFSRARLPYVRDGEAQPPCYRHVGVYGYKKTFLEQWVKLPQGQLENIERLEQLRGIEAGYKLKIINVDDVSGGIDTAEDLALARKRVTS